MPRRQRDPKRKRPLSLDQINTMQWADGFVPKGEDWPGLLAAYAQLRDEYLKRQELHPGGGRPPFVEWLYQTVHENGITIDTLIEQGDALTAPRRARFPALVVNPILAGYRFHVSGCWDRATCYALDVLDGTVTVGSLVRRACERHVRDLETGHARGLSFDADASAVAGWFYSHVDHVKGEWARPGWNPLDPRLRLEDSL
ncbi:MAG: hypothetical protein AB7R89_16300 [Dehalococcoidia bacterium]